MSTTVQDEKLSSVDQLDCVVDTDAHVLETVEELLPYFDDHHEGSRRIVESAGKKVRRDIYSVTHGLPSSAFIDAEEGSDKPKTHEYDEDYSAKEKLKEMRDFGIDYGILDPTLNLGLMTVENRQIAVALANAYNSWILDEYLDDEEEFTATILAAPHKPDEAAEEIDDRANERDMVGVFIPSTGVIPPLGHPQYDPIYEAAADNDLPVVMHGGNLATTHHFPSVRRWNETYTENHVLVHPFGHMWNLTSMIVRGVFDRFPDLDFVFQESGIAWVPYLVWRLDDHYLMRPYEFHIDTLPSEYINDRCYFSTQPLGHTVGDPELLALAIKLANPGSIMYASDLPHTDFDPPEELFNRIKSFFDPDEVRGMMGETALDVFDLNL